MANNEPDNEPILRLKEDERNKLNRKKRNNNSGDVMKEMNKKRKLQDAPTKILCVKSRRENRIYE